MLLHRVQDTATSFSFHMRLSSTGTATHGRRTSCLVDVRKCFLRQVWAILWHQLTSSFVESWRAADASSKDHIQRNEGFLLCRKITILPFDGNKKWALICKCRREETPLPAHMRWEKMCKTNRAWKISTLQRPARRLIFPLHTFSVHNALIGSSLCDSCEQVDCKLVPPVPRTMSSEVAARQKAPLITQAGWGIKHTQHVKTVV